MQMVFFFPNNLTYSVNATNQKQICKKQTLHLIMNETWLRRSLWEENNIQILKICLNKLRKVGYFLFVETLLLKVDRFQKPRQSPTVYTTL